MHAHSLVVFELAQHRLPGRQVIIAVVALLLRRLLADLHPQRRQPCLERVLLDALVTLAHDHAEDSEEDSAHSGGAGQQGLQGVGIVCIWKDKWRGEGGAAGPAAAVS